MVCQAACVPGVSARCKQQCYRGLLEFSGSRWPESSLGGHHARETGRIDNHLSRVLGFTLAILKPWAQGRHCWLSCHDSRHTVTNWHRSGRSPHRQGSCAACAPHQETQGSLPAGRGPGVARQSRLADSVSLAGLNTLTLYSLLFEMAGAAQIGQEQETLFAGTFLWSTFLWRPFCCIAAVVPYFAGAAPVKLQAVHHMALTSNLAASLAMARM